MIRNPFSTDEEIATPGFLLTIFVSGALSFIASVYFRGAIVTSFLERDFSQRRLLYFGWFFVSAVFFWLIARTFVRRWSTIEGEPVSKFAAGLVRSFLLSPLLSIWFLIFTLMYSGNGLFDAKSSRGAKIRAGIITIFIFHFFFLGFRVATKEVTLTKSFSFISREDRRLTPFQVHVFPYFSPLTKIGIAYYYDFKRSKALIAKAESGKGCTKRVMLGGIEVDDCFFTLFKAEDSLRPFATPIFALMHEGEYSVFTSKKPAGSNPFEPFAQAAVTVSDFLLLLEPEMNARGRELAAHPSGLLPYLSSPELSLLEIGKEFQHRFLVSRVLPLVLGAIDEMKAAEPSLVANATPEQGAQITRMIKRFDEESKQLLQY